MSSDGGVTRDDLSECWCCTGLHDSPGTLCPNCDEAGCNRFTDGCESDHKPVVTDGGTVENPPEIYDQVPAPSGHECQRWYPTGDGMEPCDDDADVLFVYELNPDDDRRGNCLACREHAPLDDDRQLVTDGGEEVEAEVDQSPRTMAFAFEWGEDGEFYQGQAFEDEIIVQMTDEQRKQVIAMLLGKEDDLDEFR